MKIPLKTVPKGKISISFTWDDNSIRHFSIISPLFVENGFRCTFYVVPGESGFDSVYAFGYSELQQNKFEIGSHSFSHKYMTLMSREEVEYEINESVQKIIKCTQQYPLTFAFPNHDYNDKLVDIARNYHLETRNTLTNSIRFSIKTDTSLETLIQSVNESILNKTNLVFSGHSIITDEEYAAKQIGEGYQPMRISILTDFLQYLRAITSKAEVITFAQSALRELIKTSAVLQNQEWVLNAETLNILDKFNITKNDIIALL